MNPNNITLEDITFPIKQTPVYIKTDESSDIFTRFLGKKALINASNNEPISIVSDEYEIITNEKAYNYGLTCMKTLFNLSKDAVIEIFNIRTPKTKSFCFVDLVAKKINFSCFKDDKYFPFVRITNSYNTMFKLTYRIGFCRKICKNGIIYDADSLKFSFYHMKDPQRENNLKFMQKEFEQVLNRFKSDIQILIENNYPSKYSFPLFCKAINYNTSISKDNEKIKQREIKKLNEIKQYFYSKYTQYINEVGDNFYALYNVITDYSSNGQEDNGNMVMRMNGMQIKAGLWLKKISELIRKNNIDFEDYLGDIWKNLNTQNWQN